MTVKPGAGPDGTRRTLILVLSLALAAGLAACGGKRVQPPDPTDEIVRAQITNLENPDYTVRRCAARALGRIGPRAMKAVPFLLPMLEDAEPTVRDAARLALDRINSRDRSLVRLDLGNRSEAPANPKGAFQP